MASTRPTEKEIRGRKARQVEQALDYSSTAVHRPGQQHLNLNGLSFSLLSEAHRSHLKTSAEQPEQASFPAATASVVVTTPVFAGLSATEFAAAGKSADVDLSEPILLAVLHCLLDRDECLYQTHNCSSNATCTNTVGSYNCTCDSGFSGDGTSCKDADECLYQTHNCSSNANCTNTVGSYNCTCKSGFSGDGTSCKDRDECLYQTHNCSSNATCTNSVGSYNCTCDSGFSGDGTSCKDADECLYQTHNCSSNANCTNTVGSYNCTCKSGFSGDGTSCKASLLFFNPNTKTVSPLQMFAT
ncbi:adhesion G protein-coupled receptor E2-like [Sycon ciliatum]|uniref:adhesion G protein-coupled receptor E2-like n=1 Tax=Sycon ciliatum TaxID=27933 RepID=UPI0031F62B26